MYDIDSFNDSITGKALWFIFHNILPSNPGLEEKFNKLYDNMKEEVNINFAINLTPAQKMRYRSFFEQTGSPSNDEIEEFNSVLSNEHAFYLVYSKGGEEIAYCSFIPHQKYLYSRYLRMNDIELNLFLMTLTIESGIMYLPVEYDGIYLFLPKDIFENDAINRMTDRIEPDQMHKYPGAKDAYDKLGSNFYMYFISNEEFQEDVYNRLYKAGAEMIATISEKIVMVSHAIGGEDKFYASIGNDDLLLALFQQGCIKVREMEAKDYVISWDENGKK